jgi:geranylgeranyl pyrophosphate synthase
MLLEVDLGIFLNLPKKGNKMNDAQPNIEFLLKLISSDIENFQLQFEPQSPCNRFFNEISTAYLYPLKAGGKRIRPLLTLLSAGAFGGLKAIEIARKPALAIEKIHTYSLVHDDLPCLDNDNLRRGLPTTHVIYGEAKALLVGDGLLTQAFSLLASTKFHKTNCNNYTSYLVEDLAESSGAQGMILGQWLDISLTGANHVTWEQMEVVHKNKTGKLIGASLSIGLICGISTLTSAFKESEIIEFRKNIKEVGMLIGLSFQIIDDILDSTKSDLELGKTAGKDAVQQKFTALKLLGIEKAEKLSINCTEKAISLLKEIFLNSPLITHDKEILHFRKMLISQIEILLSRPN